jgi:choline dehydrogenase-like flavoprotein
MAERYAIIARPDQNWGYQSTPQKHLKGRQMDYSRGKGLGGSSVINFACWTTGPKDDYDRWASIVGDESFNWKNARRMYNQIENYRPVKDMYTKNIKYAPGEHGQSGPVHIEYPEVWQSGFSDGIEAAANYGMTTNLDINSGDPIGMSICPSTAAKGIRWTSNFAFLQDAPANLSIVTNSPVSKVILKGTRAVGVEAKGKKCKIQESRPVSV